MSVRTKPLLTAGIAMLVGLVDWTVLAQTKPVQEPATQPAARAGSNTSTQPAGKIVATVNGEPIYESELLAGLPTDAFQQQLTNTKKLKLDRLVEELIQMQFLKDRKITVTDDELDKGLKDFEQMLQTPGCPCCGGGFKSLDQYMKIYAFTMSDIRRRVSCDVGMRLYTERLTKEQSSPEGLAEAVKKHRAEIEANYVRAYAIVFDCERDPNYFGHEKAVRAQKEKLANDALQRLKKGESFEAVAKELSEDAASAPKGGAMGCVRTDSLGPDVEQVLRALEPGACSGVIDLSWVYCIVMRKNLTEKDILTVVEEQTKSYAENQARQEFEAAKAQAKIQYGSP